MNLLRRLGALLVVAVGTVGAPIGLWIFGRSLIPTRAPSLAEIWTALTSADNGRILATALLVVGIIAWLVFLTAVLVDVAARIGHRPPLRIPGLRAPQTLASSLIGMILLGTLTLSGPAAAGNLPALPNSTGLHTPVAVSAPAVAGFSTAASHRTAAEAAPAPAPAGSVAPAAAAGPQWVVSKGDTLWEIAKASLGDPLRFPEISALNTGRVQADGQVMRDEDWLRPGWVLTLPADAVVPGVTSFAAPTAPVDVVVDEGDTLSEIAVDHDSTVDAVWAANQGRLEPGGAQLTDPNLIYPGWTITVPVATVAADDAVTPAVPTPTATTSGAAATQVPAADEPMETSPTSTDDAAAQPVTPTPPAVSPPAASATTAVPETAPTPAAPGSSMPAEEPTSSGVTGADSGSQDATDWSQTLVAGGAALLAGGLYATLRRLRRAQHRRRRPGHTFAATDPALLPWERAINGTGRAGYVDVEFLDTALRNLAAGCATADLALPDVAAARLSPTELELLLTRPAPTAPAPWTTSTDGRRWVLDRTGPATDPPAILTLDRRPAPYPALVSVAHDGDDQWLIDLEQMATGRLVGDPQRCRELARFIAAELSHNAWSQLLHVTILGWGAELTDLSPHRLVVTDRAGQALAAAAAQLQEVTDAQMSPLQGRRDEVTVDAWAPHVLIIDPNGAGPGVADLTDAVSAAAATGTRSTVALLLTATATTTTTTTTTTDPDSDAAGGADSSGAGWRIEVDADGVLHIPEWGIRGTAEALSADAARQLAQFLRSTEDAVSQPAPPSPGDAGWEEHCDTMGSLLPADGVSQDRDQPVLQLAGGEQLSSVLVMPSAAYAAASAVPAESLGVLAPMVAPRARARIEGSDRELDAELAAWHDPASTRLKVTLLGPVEVRAQGPLPGDRPRQAFYTEIVAYLVTRSRGASTAEFARALWPEDPQIIDEHGKAKPKVRKAISVARQWVGQDPDTGRNYIPQQPGVKDVLYRIEGALVDADLMRRLKVRGSARGGDAGIADLVAAHRLCQGTPLDRRRTGGYSWTIDTNVSDLTDHYLRSITDIGHVLAAHYLQRGEPRMAVEVCEQSLLAGAVDPTTRCNLVRAYRDLGDEAAAERQVQQLVDSYDVEDEVTLPPDVFAMLYGQKWQVG